MQPRHMEFGATINISNLHIMYGVQFVSQPLHTRQCCIILKFYVINYICKESVLKGLVLIK
jgi:hypothetical protein